MVEVSIVCLIYKSEQLADALFESVQKYTPMLSSGQAEFFFIANDPTEGVVKLLKSKKIPHYININEHLSEDELFSKGIGIPEYMRRVYQGYNFGVLKAKGQKIVLINSDNFFSTDWLENLLKYSDYKKVVCSTLVEPGQDRAGVFPFAIEKDFGRTLDDFKEDKFQEFAEKISKTGYTSGGAYMPCLLYKDIAVMAGLYPEGNLAGKSFNDVSRFGDEDFYDRLKNFGVEHITAKDSIVYHLKEGEKSETTQNVAPHKSSLSKPTRLNERLVVHPTNLMPYIFPEAKHQSIMDELGKKVTVLMLNPENEVEVEESLKTISNFNFKNIEIRLISANKKLVKKFKNHFKTTYVEATKTDKALYDLFHDMIGEHLLVINKYCDYDSELFSEMSDRNALYYFGGEEQINNLITDYMGHYLLPKKILINQISTFLGFLIEKGKIEVDFSDFGVKDISKIEPEIIPLGEQPQKRNIAIRAAKKLRKDGAKGFVVAVKNKALNK